jgi:hypothetical protein
MWSLRLEGTNIPLHLRPLTQGRSLKCPGSWEVCKELKQLRKRNFQQSLVDE